jgi:CTP:phosphocholine cytidylyltransferase-like protein
MFDVVCFIFIGRICPNATWEENATVVIASYYNYNGGSSYSFYPGDFVLDAYNNMYVVDSNNYMIRKYVLNNTSVFTDVGDTNSTSPYQPQYVYVDGNGTIFTMETWVNRLCEKKRDE